MAGSYGHLTGPDGGWSLIENMGDAAEATEELLWLVKRLATHDEAEALLKNFFYPMKGGKIPKDEAMIETEKAMGG